MLASALGLIGVMMVLLATLNPSPPHDVPVGTITELAGAQIGRSYTTYYYVVEFTLGGTRNSFEYSSQSALDVGTEIPLVIDSERGTVGPETTSTSSDALIVGVLFVGTAIAFLAYGAHQNGSLRTPSLDGLHNAIQRLPNWLLRIMVRVVPLGMPAFLIVAGVITGSFFLGIELKYLTLGPSERVEIISSDLSGVENTVLIVEMSTGEQRSLTVHYKDYLLNQYEVTVYPRTEPLQAKSGLGPLGPWERTVSILCGLALGIAILDRWSKWKDNYQSTTPRLPRQS